MSKKKDSTKVYKILSYIGILWIVGLFVKEKDDESVKFHVGQGMLVTITAIVISLINDLVISQILDLVKCLKRDEFKVVQFLTSRVTPAKWGN